MTPNDPEEDGPLVSDLPREMESPARNSELDLPWEYWP